MGWGWQAPCPKESWCPWLWPFQGSFNLEVDLFHSPSPTQATVTQSRGFWKKWLWTQINKESAGHFEERRGGQPFLNGASSFIPLNQHSSRTSIVPGFVSGAVWGLRWWSKDSSRNIIDFEFKMWTQPSCRYKAELSGNSYKGADIRKQEIQCVLERPRAVSNVSKRRKEWGEGVKENSGID